MTNTPNTVFNKVVYFQLALYFTCAPLLLLANHTSYILVGWGIMLIANCGSLLIALIQKPSTSGILSSELFKYVTFSVLVYTSIQLQPFVWPHAFYGIMVGQITHIASCIALGKVYAQ